MRYAKLVYRAHAVRRMFQRGISAAHVRQALEKGKIVEVNPDDVPWPSYLVLGFPNGRPLHVVAADDISARTTVIITVYWPDPRRWDKTFRHRRKRR
jgi:hypothetical protein